MKVQSALEYLLANQDWLLGLEALTRLSKFFSGLFSVAFSGFCCAILLTTRLKVVYRNMGSKHKHDRKRDLRKVSEEDGVATSSVGPVICSKIGSDQK